MTEDSRRVDGLVGHEEEIERLRKNFYHLWKPLQEARANGAVILEWDRAPEGSEGWRNRIFLDQALQVLEVSLSG